MKREKLGGVLKIRYNVALFNYVQIFRGVSPGYTW